MGRLGDHSHLRAGVAEKALKNFKKSIDRYLRLCLQKLAARVVKEAVDARKHAPGAHNYTGNLINSIVAAVYEGGQLVYAFSSLQKLKDPPIQREMTYGGAGKTHGVYHFAEDWDYQQNTNYYPAVETDEQGALYHISTFLASYKPTSNYFEIVVAYTVEYAEFVDTVNRTVGFDRVMQGFNGTLLRFQENTNKGIDFYGITFKDVK